MPRPFFEVAAPENLFVGVKFKVVVERRAWVRWKALVKWNMLLNFGHVSPTDTPTIAPER